MTHTYLVHYAEIGLKGRNRPAFEKQLIKNMRQQHAIARAVRLRGRILVESDEILDFGNVFSVAWWARVREIASQLEEIAREAEELVREILAEEDIHSFAVRVTRADKIFSKNSAELESWLGHRLQETFDLDVNLTQPDLTVYVEITREKTFVFHQKNTGPFGLPVGISGRLMGLFSGGVDSLVASYLMAKRGARLELVHFYAVRDAETAHEGKPGKLAQALLRYLPDLTVHYLPYHRFQLATLKVPAAMQKMELVVFRRFMVRAAQILARQRSARGLFTGDSLGQVASQTLANLAAVDRVCDLSLFRPLIAFDKQEIIDLSKQVGFFGLTGVSYKDCCSIIARHPSTLARLRQVRELENLLGIERLLEQTLEDRVTIEMEKDSKDTVLHPEPAVPEPEEKILKP